MKNTILFLCVLGLVVYASGESSTCLTLYKEGGAPAVFRSPECTEWILPKHDSRRGSTIGRCQSATRLGRRKYLEDRTFCIVDLRIPFPGINGIRDTSVAIVAVFDGHNGAEASEMASNMILEYFTLHTSFLLETAFSFLSNISKGMLPNKGGHDYASQMPSWDKKLGDYVLHIGRIKFTLSEIISGDFHLEILKESLLKAIDDIDAAFCKEASRYNFSSGSTAVVVLVADSQILAANVGDSKAFICSEMFQSPTEAKATLLRLYQKRRREGASIRIKDFKNFSLAASDGLPHFAAKELTKDHHPDRVDERSRVEAAGGHVIEWGGVSRVNGHLAVSRSIGDLPFKSFGVISLPEVTDWQPLTANDSYLVAVSDGVLEKLGPQDVCDLFWDFHTLGPLELQHNHLCSYSLADCVVDTALERGSMDNVAAVVVPFRVENLPTERLSEVGLQNYVGGQSWSENDNPIIDKFRQLSVEGKRATYGSFYLSKNLNENDDYTFWILEDEQIFKYVSLQALPDMLNHSYGGPITLYRDGDRDQCINPKVKEKQDSFEGTNLNTSYILKKRLGSGGFGEVWVALHRNHLQQNNDPEHGVKNIFIVKRIMVEKGKKAYLSGIREKYFGELFWAGTLSVQHPHPYYLLRMRESITPKHIPSRRPHIADEEELKHIAKYIESFESKSEDTWFVFRHEGISLSKLMYTSDEGISIRHPSNWWRWLKTTKDGQAEMKSLIWQLLMALKSCHDRNITHRDIKPENMIVCFEDQDSGRCLQGSSTGNETHITNMYFAVIYVSYMLTVTNVCFFSLWSQGALLTLVVQWMSIPQNIYMGLLDLLGMNKLSSTCLLKLY